MLRLLDARTGSYAEVRLTHPGLLRVCAHAAGGAGGPGINGLRVLLAADLLARTAELRGIQVLTVLALAGQTSEGASAFDRATDVLGIHPPAARASPHDAQVSAGGPIDVHMVGHGACVDDRENALVVGVGAVHMRQEGNQDETELEDVLAGCSHDPLAIRLALMTFLCYQPADLTEGVLTNAREKLRRWRRWVAEWAEFPSRPIPTRTAEAAQAAFSHLDTASAIALLDGLEPDPDVLPGAKFETFVYADRILGLDLAREIGQPGD